MKVKVNKTGKIVNVCPEVLAGFLADDGSYYQDDELSTELDDWSTFRREVAKDILCTLCSSPHINYKDDVKQAINITDELIRQLKEDEK